MKPNTHVLTGGALVLLVGGVCKTAMETGGEAFIAAGFCLVIIALAVLFGK